MVGANDAAGNGGIDAGSVFDDRRAGERHRVGARPLSILATPLNVLILRALAAGPLRLADLRRATGLPAQTTLRVHLKSLVAIGAVGKQPGSEMPFAIENGLTPMGHAMLDLASLLDDWLGDAPGGPIPLESGGAKGVIKALVDGWSSTILHRLADRPMSLTRLDQAIEGLSYPSIERRLATLRMGRLIQALPNIGTATPYTLTKWGRRSVAPLVTAGRYETLHMGDRAAPLTQRDVEAAFMMAMPLIGLPSEADGSCRLEVESDAIVEAVEVTVTIDSGQVVSCEADVDVTPVARAAGVAESWCVAVGEGAPEKLCLSGSHRLAELIVSGLHATLVRD